ncbi:MAPEG family protein [Steroidobacter agaridevorans]|uniref:MAPEG family protein n=1 Tax=Steroidobacter agaridevorans TaxID=2695856 RepID=UPI0013297661|nr:MAPEG family protein [Steroidobacter agaridevorans]GFE88250.1 hypothetical protein GCM10011488_32040 [Steroidobacter agaridevorans]
MNSMLATGWVAGIFALLIVPLSVQVSLRRAKTNAVFGDAGDEALRKRIRAHGNFIEYAPLAVAVLGLVEYRGGASWVVWSLAAGFVFSRVMHAIGMLFTSTPPVRAMAMLVNHASFLAAGIWLVSSLT